MTFDPNYEPQSTICVRSHHTLYVAVDSETLKLNFYFCFVCVSFVLYMHVVIGIIMTYLEHIIIMM